MRNSDGVVLRAQLEVGQGLLDLGQRLVAQRALAKAHDDRLAFARDAAVLDALVAQRAANVVRVGLDFLRERGFHVDLQQKVHAAAQVEAEIHGQRADRRQPLRAARDEVQRDDVILAEPGLQRVFRAQLRIGVLEARLDARRVEKDRLRGDLVLLEDVFDAAAKRRVRLQRRLERRDLHRRHFAEEIGQRDRNADDERDAR